MSNLKHGKCNTRIYYIWKAMISRCYNVNAQRYSDYGGRGIVVAPEWHSFARFYSDMGDRPSGMSLDRKDNDGRYSPFNCRWATPKEQAGNKRTTQISILCDGHTLSVSEWADKSGIAESTIRARLARGWSDEEAVSIPIVTNKKGITRGEKTRDYQLVSYLVI